MERARKPMDPGTARRIAVRQALPVLVLCLATVLGGCQGAPETRDGEPGAEIAASGASRAESGAAPVNKGPGRVKVEQKVTHLFRQMEKQEADIDRLRGDLAQLYKMTLIGLGVVLLVGGGAIGSSLRGRRRARGDTERGGAMEPSRQWPNSDALKSQCQKLATILEEGRTDLHQTRLDQKKWSEWMEFSNFFMARLRRHPVQTRELLILEELAQQADEAEQVLSMTSKPGKKAVARRWEELRELAANLHALLASKLQEGSADAGRSPNLPAPSPDLGPLKVRIEGMDREIADLKSVVFTGENSLSAWPAGSAGGRAQPIPETIKMLSDQVDGVARQVQQLGDQLGRDVEENTRLGSILQNEFRQLCQTQAADLKRRLAEAAPRGGSSQAQPPIVERGMAFAKAVDGFCTEARGGPSVSPGVNASLSQLLARAAEATSACPNVERGSPPPPDLLLELPDRPDAAWKPEYLMRLGGNLQAAITRYSDQLSSLLNEALARFDPWVRQEATSEGAQQGAIQDWLTQRVLPLLDGVRQVLAEEGEVVRELRSRLETERSLRGARQRLEEEFRKLEELGELTKIVRTEGEPFQGGPDVAPEFADRGQAPGTVLEVLQEGYRWKGRVLRRVRILVQQLEGGPMPQAALADAAHVPAASGGWKSADAPGTWTTGGGSKGEDYADPGIDPPREEEEDRIR